MDQLDHHQRAGELVIDVGLVVALILALGGIGLEGQERLERMVVDGTLDDGSARGVVSREVAVLEQEVEQLLDSMPAGSGRGMTDIAVSSFAFNIRDVCAAPPSSLAAAAPVARA